MSDRPVIGEFRSKTENKPREELKAPVAPVATAMGETKKEEEKTIPVTPVELYQARLKEAGIPLEQARIIYDELLTKGYHEETIMLRKGIRAVFRTRQYDDTLRLQTEFESVQPRLAMTQGDIVTRFNLAASLYEWKGEAIKHEGDDDFDKALALVRKLPGPVFSLLAGELSKFDEKIMLVFSPGSTENFI